MVRSTARFTALLMVGLLIPLAGFVAPAAALHHEDECAGGIDASNNEFNASALQRYAGCVGRLYNAPADSTNHGPDDFKDAYEIKVDGTGTAYLHWQLCNNAKAGYLFYDVYWDGDLIPRKRATAGGIYGGTCTSSEPVTLSGNYKPGFWVIIVHTIEGELPENKNMDYFLYAQPLWR